MIIIDDRDSFVNVFYLTGFDDARKDGAMGEKFKTFISCTKEDNMKLLAFVIVLLAIIAFFGW